MSWYDSLTDSVGSIYDNAVSTGTDYFNTSINGFTRDPAPAPSTGSTGGRGENSVTKTAENDGLFGYSWSAIAAIAAVLGVVVIALRR